MDGNGNGTLPYRSFLAGCSGTKDAAESTQAEAETSAEEAAAEEETAKESDLDKLTLRM